MHRLTIRNTNEGHADEAAFGFRRPVSVGLELPNGETMTVADQLTGLRLQAEAEFPPSEGYEIVLERLVADDDETSTWHRVDDVDSPLEA